MYQYILCLSKLPRAWADILLLRSGVLQPGLQYSKVTTGRVCAFGKVWGERGACGEEVGWGVGIKAVMGRQMKLSLCSHVYSTFFHHAHTTAPPLPPSHAQTMLEFTHLPVALIRLARYVDVSRHVSAHAWTPTAIILSNITRGYFIFEDI